MCIIKIKSEIIERGVLMYESTDARIGSKSEGDYVTALRELRARKTPNDVDFGITDFRVQGRKK